MGNSVCMIELSSIARGIETCDQMLKAADVQLLRSSTICPGKYMVIIGGNTSAVNASMKAGEETAGEFLVDKLFIANVSDQLMPAISGTTQVATNGAHRCHRILILLLLLLSQQIPLQKQLT